MEIYWTAFVDALWRFLRKGGMVSASHVALSTMLAIFPFCILALSVAGMLSEAGLAASGANLGDILDVVFGSWPDSIAEPIAEEARRVLETSSGSAVTLGAILTIVFASNGFEAIRYAISAAYHDRDDPRPFWKQRLLTMAFALGGALVVTAVGVAGVLVPLYVSFIDTHFPAVHFPFPTNETLNSLFTFAALLFALTACHKWLPGVHRPVRALLPGILLTLVLWAVAATGFEFYIRTFPTYSVTYAGLAGVMSALVFLYLIAAIFVLGAEYNARLGEIAKERKSARQPSE